MSRIPLIYYTNKKFYTQYTHPTLICRRMDARMDGQTDNIYSIFRDTLLLLGEHMSFAQKKGVTLHPRATDFQENKILRKLNAYCKLL